METFTISRNADLRITVQELEDHWNSEGRLKVGSRDAVFEVERSKLCTTKYFCDKFRGDWKKCSPDQLVLQGDSIEAMELLFRGLHDTLDSMTLSTVSMVTVWRFLVACDKYDRNQIDNVRSRLNGWFGSWFDIQEGSGHYGPGRGFESQSLYPCYKFDNAEGFQKVSRVAVYNSEHATDEKRPENAADLESSHLPLGIHQQLNAARGRLRHVLHKDLFDDVAELLDEADCSYKEATFFDYFKQLKRIEV